MRLNNFLHLMGVIGSIGGIIGLHQYGWVVYQWPVIALLWIFSSYMNCLSHHRQKSVIQELENDKRDLSDKLSKADLKIWENEFKLAKSKS